MNLPELLCDSLLKVVSASFSLLSGSPVIFQVNVFLTLGSLFQLLSNGGKNYITFCIYLREEFDAAVQQEGYLLVAFFSWCHNSWFYTCCRPLFLMWLLLGFLLFLM